MIDGTNPPQLMNMIPLYAFVVDCGIPTVIMTYAYIRMGLTLRSSRSQTANKESKITSNDKLKKAEVNLFQTCLMLMVLFVLCWSNNCFAVSLYMIGVLPNLGGTYYHISVMLIVFNSCLNPYVYTLRYKQFQQQIRKLVRCG